MTFIIAEVGSNWNNLEDCLESIQCAKVCGADAVKFQAYTGEALYGTPQVVSNQLPLEWLPKLKEKADAVGIEFMCTAFSPELVDKIDPYVKRHKIASAENTWPQLLQKVASKKKPIIMSCGGSNIPEIKLSIGLMEDCDLTLLYCVSAYPCYAHNLFKMEKLKELGRPVGLSDHSLDVIYTPLSAVKHFGAVVVEKHFRLQRIVETPDSGHSLSPLEFKLMVDHIRGKELPYRSSEEKGAELFWNRRLIATKDISVGQKLKYGENYGAYRSQIEDAHALHPLAWTEIEEKTCIEPVKVGGPIKFSTFRK